MADLPDNSTRYVLWEPEAGKAVEMAGTSALTLVLRRPVEPAAPNSPSRGLGQNGES
jgi:hypothetical protein